MASKLSITEALFQQVFSNTAKSAILFIKPDFDSKYVSEKTVLSYFLYLNMIGESILVESTTTSVFEHRCAIAL